MKEAQSLARPDDDDVLVSDGMRISASKVQIYSHRGAFLKRTAGLR